MNCKIVGSYVDYEYGYGGYTGNQSFVEETIATFDDKKDAIKYIKDSRLKNPPNRERPFKNKSLLSNFQYADIEELDDPVPHNPRVGK